MREERSDRLQWIGPAPPLRTGIANYTEDFFRAVDGRWGITTFLEARSAPGRYRTIRAESGQPDPALPTVLNIGNSEFHERAFDLGLSMSGVLVLHDVVLHHALAAFHLRTGRMRDYWRELEQSHGHRGVEFGRSLLAGRDAGDVEQFPLSEQYVSKAAATIVHNSYAARAVKRGVPEADVHVVPMGIPIPAVVSREIARDALGLPRSAFVIVSISHVNPNKRIPVVLRALRRLVARSSDVLFVLAGTGSDRADLTREIRILGLEPYVVQLGYADEQTARLLASAADACVNLRFPTTGETSASLLRLLGVGLPVLVSDAGASQELPDGVGLKIPVDEHEVEMIVEVLWALATNDILREDAGQVARDFVINNHSMKHQVDGYRRVLKLAFGIDLPGLDHIPTEKPPEINTMQSGREESVTAKGRIVTAISELGLADQEPVIASSARALVELGLDRGRRPVDAVPSAKLLDRLICPRCGGELDDAAVCRSCREPVTGEGGLLDLR